MGTIPVEILVVDDHKGLREGIVRILDDEFGGKGVRVLSAENGEQAAAVVRDGMLVLLDINMPKINGYGVLAYMKDHGIRPAKVIITGSNAANPRMKKAMEQKVQQSYDYPEDVIYLPKPIDMNELNQTASEALGIPLGD